MRDVREPSALQKYCDRVANPLQHAWNGQIYPGNAVVRVGVLAENLSVRATAWSLPSGRQLLTQKFLTDNGCAGRVSQPAAAVTHSVL